MINKQDCIDKIRLIANYIDEERFSKDELDELIECASCLRRDIDSENVYLYVIIYDTVWHGKTVRMHRLLGKTTFKKARNKLISFYEPGMSSYVCKISEDQYNDYLCLYYLHKINEYYGYLKQYHVDMGTDINCDVLDKIKYFRKKLRLYFDNEYIELDWECL